MAERPKAPSPPNELEREFSGPFTRPESEEGIGPTLGEDVGAAHQRDEDKRNHAGRA
jgi:hypothetical protein